MKNMTFKEYLQNIGLIINGGNPQLPAIIDSVDKAAKLKLTKEIIRHLYIYDVPKLSSDGSCSILGEKADKPYNLATTFDIVCDLETLKNHPQTERLWKLHTIVKNLYELTHVNWLGIYRKVKRGKDDFLLKESYLGAMSRPEFPLTAGFAKKSNNSTVGLTGKAKIIQDVSANQGPYYKCDGKVQSEFCLPILDQKDSIIGIIDAESFTKNFFTKERLLNIAKVAYDLGQKNVLI